MIRFNMIKEYLTNCCRLSALAALVAMLQTGCEISSPTSVARDVGSLGTSVNITGFYQNISSNNNARIVAESSGEPIETLDLRQAGDLLEAIDNNGNVFHGTIGDVVGTLVNITLDGKTTAGAVGTISGSVSVGGVQGNSEGTMTGTWIEPDQFSTVYATATIPGFTQNNNPTNNPGTFQLTVNVSPSGAGTVNPSSGSFASGSTVTLTATPASGHTFSSWSGDASGSNPTTSVIMNADKTVQANFN